MESQLEVLLLIHVFGGPGLQFMDLGGGADTVLRQEQGTGLICHPLSEHPKLTVT